MTKKLAILTVFGIFCLASLIITLYTKAETPQLSVTKQASQESSCNRNEPGMANPAAIYCTNLGYDYKIITNEDNSQYGICIFNTREQCEEWQFLEGKCGQKYNYCAKQGYTTKIKTDGRNTFSKDYAVCVNEKGKEIGSVVNLMKLLEKSTKGTSKEEDILEQNEINTEYKTESRTLPNHFDWRDYNEEDWMTSVKEQGICSSCWAFAGIGVVESTYNIRSGNPDLDLDLSEEYLVSDCHTYNGYQNCCGGYTKRALEFINNTGIPDELCMPYVDGLANGCNCPSGTCNSLLCTYNTGLNCSDKTCSDRCSNWVSRIKKINDTHTYTAFFGFSLTQEEIKQLLLVKGPVRARMSWHTSYWDNGIVKCAAPSQSQQLHDVILVGYNDFDQYWIAKNSWGDTWNEDGYFKIGYGQCFIDLIPIPNSAGQISYADLTDLDNDTIADVFDNCPNTFNPAQGDIDNDLIGDACDTADSAFEKYFFGDYHDTQGINYDNVMGGGPCNQVDGCEYSDSETDKAYCNGSNWPNYCVYQGTCYKGDGSEIVDIDGDEFDKHEAICVGFGWWDLDSGTDSGDTPLPGIEVCEMAGYTWATGETGIGEYQWNYNGYGCCGDDEGESYGGGVCNGPAKKIGPLKENLLSF